MKCCFFVYDNVDNLTPFVNIKVYLEMKTKDLGWEEKLSQNHMQYNSHLYYLITKNENYDIFISYEQT